MSLPAAPPATPQHAAGWTAVAVGERSLLVRATAAGFETIVSAPRLAKSVEGRPLVALTLVLSRAPAAADSDLLPLIATASLALTVTLAPDGEELRALRALHGAPVAAYFVRSGEATLAGPTATYARSAIVGSGAQLQLGCVLPPNAALDVLGALGGRPSALAVRIDLHGAHAPILHDVPLHDLLGHALDGLDRTSYISMIVVHPDGTASKVPSVRRDLPPGSRDAVPVRTDGVRAVALPFALTAAPHVSAAALIAGGASASPVAAAPNVHVYPVHDLVAELAVTEGDAKPSEHLPLVDTNVAGPVWPDAITAAQQWYLPTFALVPPGAHDDPATTPYLFAYGTTGLVVGSGAQTGLGATVRFTFRVAAPPGTPAGAQPAPIDGLTCALEIPYRQSGSPAFVKQRFPGTVVKNGDAYEASIELLDDFVRLGYAALAYPPASGAPPPQLIVDFTFRGYAWIWVRIPTDPPDNPGIPIHGPHGTVYASVATAAQLPLRVTAATIVRDQLAVVGPTSYVQYRREAPGAARDFSKLHLNTAAIAVAPVVAAVHPPPQKRVLSSRSFATEVTLPCGVPCASAPAAYVQRGDGGAVTAVGCQDALKLGETSLKAFAELPELRDPAFRVYRSLQQPARFLLAPTAYRVGRYGAAQPDRAFRPMVELFGLLDPDPAKNRYALTATLLPDVSPGALAKLLAALTGAVSEKATPSIVYPTDPFVGAALRFTWTVPTGLETPQAIMVVDALNVTATMTFDDALLVMTMVDKSGLLGAVTFTLPDGTALSAALTIDGNAIGPPESGPVTVAVAGTTATLRNRTQSTMHVTDVIALAATGAPAAVAADATLAPGATATVSVPAGTTTAFADATPAAQQSIEELDVFVDDVTIQVTFINQVTFANHKLTALAVTTRLKGLEHVETVALPEGATASTTFSLPITTYLAHRTLQYALVETTAAGTTTTAWRDWDLTTGTVVGITADQV